MKSTQHSIDLNDVVCILNRRIKQNVTLSLVSVKTQFLWCKFLSQTPCSLLKHSLELVCLFIVMDGESEINFTVYCNQKEK